MIGRLATAPAERGDAHTTTDRLFYSARTQYENLGDLVINRELLTMLRPFGRFCIDVRGVPAWYRAAIGVAPVEAETSSWSFSLRLLGAALRRRIGGDAGQVYLILNPGGFQGGLTLFGAARLTAIVAAFAVLRVIGVRICRFGASIGPFAPLRARLEACKTWFMYAPTARDSLSLAYATSIGMRGVRYFPDLAFAMHPVIANTTDRELPARYVVFSFREIRAAHRRTALLSWLDALCVRLREAELAVVLVSQVAFDTGFNEALAERYRDQVQARHLGGTLSEAEILGIYRGAACVVSNRLHVLLFALVLRVPAFAPDANEKIRGILADSHLDQLLVDTAQLHPALGRIPPDADFRQEFVTTVRKLIDTKQEEIASNLERLFTAKAPLVEAQ